MAAHEAGLAGRTGSRDILYAAIAVVLVAAAASLGALATVPNLAPWYEGLEKPAFTPPNGAFGPVWTALYLLMAIALWRVLRRRAETPGRRLAITLFLVQLALNVLWSFLFFGAHSPALGLLDIFPQLVLIVASIAAFARVERLAGALLVPLALWVGYAALLNFEVWRLN